MPRSTLLLSWTAVRHDVMYDVLRYCEMLLRAQRIDGYTPVITTLADDTADGFALLLGDARELAQLKDDPRLADWAEHASVRLPVG